MTFKVQWRLSNDSSDQLEKNFLPDSVSFLVHSLKCMTFDRVFGLKGKCDKIHLIFLLSTWLSCLMWHWPRHLLECNWFNQYMFESRKVESWGAIFWNLVFPFFKALSKTVRRINVKKKLLQRGKEKKTFATGKTGEIQIGGHWLGRVCLILAFYCFAASIVFVLGTGYWVVCQKDKRLDALTHFSA